MYNWCSLYLTPSPFSCLDVKPASLLGPFHADRELMGKSLSPGVRFRLACVVGILASREELRAENQSTRARRGLCCSQALTFTDTRFLPFSFLTVKWG